MLRSILNRSGLATLFVICSSVLLQLPASANEVIVVQPVIAGTAGTATPNIPRDLLFASAIYGQVSIDIDFLPTETDTSLSSNVVENDTSVLSYLASPTYTAVPEITVFYVATIDNSAANRGASSCLGSSCAVWVANSAANDTLAHEVAHLLTDFLALWDENPSDPAHSMDPTNLLASGNIRQVPSTTDEITMPGSDFDRIAPVQESAMLASPYVQTEVPEPQSKMLISTGIVLILCSLCLRRAERQRPNRSR